MPPRIRTTSRNDRLRSLRRERSIVLATALSLLIAIGLGPLGTRGLAQDRTAETSLHVNGEPTFAKEMETLIKEDDKDKQATAPPVTLMQRAQAQKQAIEKALGSRGFYGGTVSVTVAGRPVDDPDTLDAVEAIPEGGKVPVSITVETGPTYKLSAVTLSGPASEAAARAAIDRGKLPLELGTAADARTILRLDDAILRQLQEQGYALARIDKRLATVDHAKRDMTIDYQVVAGPATKMGPVSFSGSKTVETRFLERRVPFSVGDRYKPERLDELRDSLGSLGLFSSIRIMPANQLDAAGDLPIAVELEDRLPRTIGFGLSYETSTGFAIGAFWLHRNLLGEGESLRLAAEVNHIGEGAFTDVGFAFTATFRKPDWWEPRTDAVATAQFVREFLDAYDRQAVVLTGGFERRFSKELRGRAGLSVEASQITQHGDKTFYKLLGVPMGLIWDKSNNLLEPTKGFRLALDATPYVTVNDPGKPFVITKVIGSTYLDLLGGGRTVIATRAAVGIIPGLGEGAIPPDKRFYVGGGGSVRGFAYQSVGPQDHNHNPLGGTSMFEASIELRQRIGSDWGVVAFVDTGNVFDSLYPTLKEAPRVGAGIGVRYYTDFGPIRADVAVPLNRRPSDDWFGLYVSIGQAF